MGTTSSAASMGDNRIQNEVTNEWKRFYLTGIVPEGETTITRSAIQIREPGEYVEVEIADWQLEQKPYPTPFQVGTRATLSSGSPCRKHCLPSLGLG